MGVKSVGSGDSRILVFDDAEDKDGGKTKTKETTLSHKAKIIIEARC